MDFRLQALEIHQQFMRYRLLFCTAYIASRSRSSSSLFCAKLMDLSILAIFKRCEHVNKRNSYIG